jgi:hypothetical protein
MKLKEMSENRHKCLKTDSVEEKGIPSYSQLGHFPDFVRWSLPPLAGMISNRMV